MPDNQLNSAFPPIPDHTLESTVTVYEVARLPTFIRMVQNALSGEVGDIDFYAPDNALICHLGKAALEDYAGLGPADDIWVALKIKEDT